MLGGLEMPCGQQHYHIEPCGKGKIPLSVIPLVVLIVAVIWVVNHVAEILMATAILCGSMLLLTGTSIGCIMVVNRTRYAREAARERIGQEDIPIISYRLYPELEEKEYRQWLTDLQEPSKRIGD